MTRRTTPWIAALTIGVALFAAGCASSSGSPSSAAAASQPSSVAPSSESPAASPGGSPAATAGASQAIPSFALPNDDKGLEALLPSKLCDKDALKFSFSGDRFANNPEPTLNDTLAQLGRTAKDVSMAIATPNPVAGGTCDTAAGVFRVKGVDPNRLRDVYIAEAQKQDNTTYTTGNVGGKDVYIGTRTGGDTKSYAYFKGDALFFVAAKDDAEAAPVLQAMP